ncbi:alpha/beta fold hydrolase [Microbacterium indicum]|uniref:alpha/beta fold hydrolase n=1 Tax=Microbacterium indicum TaxID=358100 RepID=UPI00049105AA|nr:alpha/beta hydrolase [Microbacterium indicum]
MPLPLVTEMPEPQYVMSPDGIRIATYSWGDEDQPTVIAVHGFASSAKDNWAATGWVRDLQSAGLRVIAIDQRGHGASEKPTEATAYRMGALVADVATVIDTYTLEQVRYLGYSLGARVGWHVLKTLREDEVERAVLGGIPDGKPLGRLDLDQARAYADHGVEVTDPVTRNYVTLADRVPGNEIRALVALAEGMRFDHADPDLGAPPHQPLLIAAGSEDRILEDARGIADRTPGAGFLEIPKRHHFNAPGARPFREAGVAFLAA